jgi:hypothetical protein
MRRNEKDWVHLAQDMDQCLALVNMVTNKRSINRTKTRKI